MVTHDQVMASEDQTGVERMNWRLFMLRGMITSPWKTGHGCKGHELSNSWWHFAKDLDISQIYVGPSVVVVVFVLFFNLLSESGLSLIAMRGYREFEEGIFIKVGVDQVCLWACIVLSCLFVDHVIHALQNPQGPDLSLYVLASGVV